MKIQINNAKSISGQINEVFNLYLSDNTTNENIKNIPDNWQADTIIDAQNNYVFSNVTDLSFLSNEEFAIEKPILQQAGNYLTSNISYNKNSDKSWLANNQQHSDNHIVLHNKITSQDLPSFINILNYAKSCNKIVYINANILNPSNMLGDDSHISIRLGLGQNLSCYETSSLFTILSLINYVKCNCFIYDISCNESLDIIYKFKKNNDQVKFGLNIHHLLLSNNDLGFFDTKYKFNPPLRSLANQQLLVQGINNNLIDFVYSGHSMINLYDKQVPFAQAKSGSGSGEIFIPLLFKLADLHHINLEKVLQCANISTCLDVNNLVIFNPNCEWQFTGKNINSQSKINCFNKYPLIGKVEHTILKQNNKFNLYSYV